MLRLTSLSFAIALLVSGLAGCQGEPDEAAGGPDAGADWVSGPAIRVDVRPDGTPMVAQRETPEVVSGCMPGGNTNGRTVTYQETQTETRTRSVGFANYDADLAQRLDLPSDPHELDLDLAGAFGLDPHGTVSSSDDDGLSGLSDLILPGEFGVFYRQAIKLHRTAGLWAVTEAGDEYRIGEVILTDWDFLGGLGVGPTCNPLPPPPASLGF